LATRTKIEQEDANKHDIGPVRCSFNQCLVNSNHQQYIQKRIVLMVVFHVNLRYFKPLGILGTRF